ncbi:hypothetical protein [Shewanella algae]|uniref:hypothetical protein n=1 Tax=Shewanella algae TaxID=38313 RepID=UPI003006A1F8
MGISGSSSAIPNLANKALLADIQAFEPYASSALNRKLRGIINPGIYHGFDVVPGEGLAVLIQSPGDSAAAVEVGESYLLTVRQQASVSVPVPAGRRSVICLKVVYSLDIETDQVNADSQVKAAEIVAVNVGDEPAGSIILAEVNVPSDVTAITAPMIDLLRRQSVSLEGFWEKINSGEIRPKLGLWARAQPEKGFLPAADKTGAEAKESIGKPGAWFKEVWANAFRGGSIDVTGPIKSGGKNAMLVGDYGLGGASMLLNDGYDLRKLPAANAYYRGQKLLNAPGNSAEWFYIKTEVHSDGYMRIEASNFGGSKEFWCANVNGKWTEWNTRYSTNFKPTNEDIGLGNLSIGAGRILSITSDFGSTSIGMKNASWSHYETSAPEGHYFYKKAWIQQELRALSTFISVGKASLNAGADIIGDLSVSGNISAKHGSFTGSGNDYNTGGLEVKGGGTSNRNVVPTLGFHQPGVYGASIQLWAGSDYRFYQQGGAAYASVTVENLFASGQVTAHLSPSSWITGFKTSMAYKIPTVGNTSGFSSWMSQRTVGGGFAIGTLGDTWYLTFATKANIDANTNSATPRIIATATMVTMPGVVQADTFQSSSGQLSFVAAANNQQGMYLNPTDKRTIIGGGSAGKILLRPNGISTTAGEWTINASGVLETGNIPWARLSGVPVYATRWPSAAEVGLSNVPNTVHTSAATANTVAVRDSAGDLFARLFRSNYANQNTISGAIAFRINNSSDSYLRFCSDPAAVRAWLGAAAANHSHTWAQISGIPATATRWPSWGEVSGKPTYATRWPTWNEVSSKPTYALRWPTWDEVSGKPTFAANPFIKFYDSVGISKLRLPTAAINHLKAGRDVEVRWLMKLEYQMKWETQLLVGSTWSQRPSYRGLSQDVSWWWIYTGYHTSSGNDGCIVTESNRLIRAEYRLL